MISAAGTTTSSVTLQPSQECQPKCPEEDGRIIDAGGTSYELKNSYDACPKKKKALEGNASLPVQGVPTLRQIARYVSRAQRACSLLVCAAARIVQVRVLSIVRNLLGNLEPQNSISVHKP
eukprot:1184634-Prorocentrum_minimum.AAC.2